ncbi:TldD/PmbA family protein [Thermogladius sp. 4427co]|uniref:TldD/PmbA family protein n=1 Tax=Thermogladius sp. 4427co TaxID=3450718 RepID=UPI003F7967EE
MEAEELFKALNREASKRGFSELEVVRSRVERVSAYISRNEIKPVLRTVRTTYGLRGAIGRRVGGISVSDAVLNIDEALGYLERVVRNSPEDRYWPGFPPAINRGFRAETYHSRVDELGEEYAIELAGRLVSSILDKGRGLGADKTFVMRGLVEWVKIELSIANTSGVDVVEKCSLFSGSGSIKAVYGGVESTFDFSVVSRRIDEKELLERAVKAAEYTRMFKNATTPASGVYDIILTPRVFAETLSAVLIPAVSGLNIAEKRSPLYNKIGDKVLDSSVSIIDDPTLPLEAGSRNYDDEGVGVMRKHVFDKGVFKTPLTNYYTSRRLNTEPSGNGFRPAPGSATVPSPTNIVVEKGSGGIEDFKKDVRKGLIVYAIIGGWMSNFVSGTVSFTVTHGILVENGLEKPVKSFVVTGNIYEWLGDKIIALGSDTESNFGYITPSLYARGARVSGS